jgi:hypothetical protein
MAARPGPITERRLIIVAGGLAGAVLAAAPTGVEGLDRVWCAALVAGLVYAGSYASALVLLPAGALAAVIAGSGRGLALAAAGVVVAALTAGQARPSSRLTGLSAGCIALAVVERGDGSPLLGVLGGAAVVVGIAVSGWQGTTVRRRRGALWVVLPVGGLLLLCGAAGLLGGLRARGAVLDGIDALRAARAAATSGDVDGAIDRFRDAERRFQDAGDPLHGYGRLGLIVPGLSQQLDAATVAVDTAADSATALRQVGRSLRLDDVALRGGAVDLTAIAEAEEPLDAAVAALDRTTRRLASIDRDPLIPPIRDSLDDALEEAMEAGKTARRAHRAVQQLPSLLGGAEPTRYLVLFTSPVEARNRFGFPGSYAVVGFDGGRLSIELSGPIDQIDDAEGTFGPSAVTVPARALPYIDYGVARTWRSVTIPSDGPAVADLAVQLGALSGLGELDGVVLADPHTLAALIGLVGPVPIPGLDLTIDESTTVDYLVRRQYLEFPELGQNRDRKDALVDVAGIVGLRLSALSLGSIQDLAERFAPLVDRGHLVVSVPPRLRPDAAALFADLGIDGGFEAPSGSDLLYVGQRNHVGNKIDLFLRRDVDYRVEVADDGHLSSHLRMDVTNDAPESGLPEYVIGSAQADPPPPGTNLSTTLIYSPHQLLELTVDGAPVTPASITEGGFLVYQVELDLGPGQTRRIEATFEGVAAPGDYALRYLPAPLVVPDRLTTSFTDARSGRASAPSVAAVDGPVCLGLGRSPHCPR